MASEVLPSSTSDWNVICWPTCSGETPAAAARSAMVMPVSTSLSVISKSRPRSDSQVNTHWPSERVRKASAVPSATCSRASESVSAATTVTELSGSPCRTAASTA